MKKLLSAVTSVAMSLSLMAGAFASPVSAAGGNTASQPKLNMGGVLDVSANKNAGESVEWNIGTGIAAPGMSVTVPVVVSKSTLEVTSAQFKINPASPLTLKSVSAGEGYGANASYDKDLIVLERSSGKGVVAANDSVVINLTFSVPSDCPEGTYDIKASDLFVSNAKSADITSGVKINDGKIKVQKEITNGNISWVLDNVEGAPGETVTLKAYVNAPNDAVLAVAGAQFKIKTESPIEFKSLKAGGAYASPISFDESVQTYLFDTTTGKGVVAADKATIMNISYTIPSTCPEGTYKVSWSDGFVSDGHTADITSNVKFVDGSITVGKPKGDKIKWTLSNKTAKPGDVVTMTATVENKANIDLPVGGAQFSLDAKSPITYNNSIKEGDAYGAAIKSSSDVNRFVFDLGNKGKSAADGSTIFSADFKVPDNCPEGVYSVKWAETFVSDSKSNDVTSEIVLVDGTITVGDTTVVDGTATWVIPSEVKAEAGKSVELVAKVKGDSTLAVAGAQFSIVGTDPTKLNSVTGTPYGMTLSTDPEYKANCIFENASGKTAKDGDVLFTIKFDVPAGTPDGLYPVKWSKQFVTNEKSVDITDKVTFVDGSIRVGNPSTTTSADGGSTTTTVTTTTATPEGALVWQIDTKRMESPQIDTEVELRVYVNDKNNAKVGVAGAQFRIANDDGIKFKSATGTTAYNGELSTSTEADEKLNAFMFTTKDAKNVAAANDSNVVVLKFVVPANCPAGTYNVDFVDGTLNVADEKTNDITKHIIGLGGAIIIDPQHLTPTTTSVSSTSTTATDTTTSVTVSSTTTASDTTTTSGSGTTTTVSGSSTTTTVSDTTTTSGSGTTTTVSGSGTTTTTATGTTTTIPTGAIIWEVDTVHAKPGDTVKVNMYVRDPNNVKLGVAGAQFTVKPSITGDKGAELASVGAKSGYGSDVITGNDNNIRFFFADQGEHIALDGAVVVEFNYKVGANAVPGTDIALNVSDLFVSNGKTVDITKNVIAIDGKIIIDPIVTSTTITDITTSGSGSSTTTTTTVSGTTTTSGSGTTTVSGSSTTTTASGTTTTVSGSTTTVSGSSTTTTVSGTTTTVSGSTTTVSGSSTTTTASGTTTTSGSGTTTTISGVVRPGILTTTTQFTLLPDTDKYTTTTEAGYLYSIATVETKPGFYFSHDNGVRALGDKTGFSPDQVTELKIVDVFEDGRTKERSSVDMSWINFGMATPQLVYGTPESHKKADAVVIDDFKYEVPVIYGLMPLVNEDGDALTVTVYIGVKGDITLSNLADAVDASAVLSYYAACQTYKSSTTTDSKEAAKEAKNKIKCTPDKGGLAVSSADDILDHFAAFLGDVDQDEYDPKNWSYMKDERTVNAVDASFILSYYATAQTSNKQPAEIWNEVLGK